MSGPRRLEWSAQLSNTLTHKGVHLSTMSLSSSLVCSIPLSRLDSSLPGFFAPQMFTIHSPLTFRSPSMPLSFSLPLPLSHLLTHPQIILSFWCAQQPPLTLSFSGQQMDEPLAAVSLYAAPPQVSRSQLDDSTYTGILEPPQRHPPTHVSVSQDNRAHGIVRGLAPPPPSCD